MTILTAYVYKNNLTFKKFWLQTWSECGFLRFIGLRTPVIKKKATSFLAVTFLHLSNKCWDLEVRSMHWGPSWWLTDHRVTVPRKQTLKCRFVWGNFIGEHSCRHYLIRISGSGLDRRRCWFVMYSNWTLSHPKKGWSFRLSFLKWGVRHRL